MARLTPSQIYARQEAKNRKVQERAIIKRRRATEASARAQIKRIQTIEKQNQKAEKQRIKQQASLLRKRQKAKRINLGKHKRIARRIWRRLI